MTKPILAALLAAASVAAFAADPADPASPVVATPYRSPFADLPSGVEEQTVDWKKANADVAQFPRGHVDLLKWEERNPPAASPARPASAAAQPQAPAAGTRATP